MNRKTTNDPQSPRVPQSNTQPNAGKGGGGKTEGGCCSFHINVHAAGDVHIHNNCAPPAQEPCGGGTDGGTGGGAGETSCCGSVGTCLPVVAGAKHKLSREQKLAGLAARNPIASALAATLVHSMRRFVAGKAAANTAEQHAFATFRKMPMDFLRCNVSGFEGLPAPLRNQLFVPGLLPDVDVAVTPTQLADALTAEVKQRAAVTLFGDPAAGDEERPGLVRLYTPSGEDFFSQVRICRVNNLRTGNYLPMLDPAVVLPTELQQDCGPVIVNGQAQVVCNVRTADCPGNQLAGACARVLDIAQGDGVELQGVNYFSIDSKVRLTNNENPTITRDVDGFVWGDVSTPLNETVNGATQLINDCRVEDKLTFQVPDDLPPGIYQIQVMVPNTPANPGFGPFIFSNTEFINILPPPDAKFQIVMKRIYAREETSPSWWGSDEVGLHTVSCGLNLSQEPMEVNSIEFHALDGVEFDSGTARDITTVIFNSDTPILALVLGVMGYEIDSEHAYHAQISSWTDYFVYAVKQEWSDALAGLAAAGGISAAVKFGWTGAIVAAIAVVVVVAIDLLVSLWAPADLIIQDTIALSIVDLDRLTSAAAPAPPSSSHTTEGGIVVNVGSIPPVKVPFQYTEVREYVSSDQDSRYELTYQYNRLQ